MAGRPGWPARLAWLALIALLAASWLRADVAPPPKPDRYFTDQANVVDAATASQINEQLAQFERDTSNQIVVAIYPSLPPGADLAQYAVMTGRAWGVGQAGASKGATKGDNGALLLVFVNDHQMYIATGYGLEGALPDITCKQIITNEIAPAFRNGDYAGGIQAGVNAMIAATKGEYQGNGSTHQEQEDQHAQQVENDYATWIFIAIFILIIVIRFYFGGFGSGPTIFTGGGSSFGGWGGGFGGGGFGGGGGGGFSGFSGGGGSFGGGGAGGSW
jgi:uncharacterized protein